jgi:hypothetical protein
VESSYDTLSPKKVKARVPESPASANDSALDFATQNVPFRRLGRDDLRYLHLSRLRAQRMA